MKKVAIITRSLDIGGIETSLINLLEQINQREYDVTLYTMTFNSVGLGKIPEGIKHKCIYGNHPKKRIIYNLKHLKIIQALKILLYTYLSIASKSVSKEEYYLSKIIPIDNQEYDISISYHTPASFPVEYNIKYIKSKFKLAWIHTDIDEEKNNMSLYEDYYKYFDKIFCVSKSNLLKFNNAYPYLSAKTSVFYNIINKKIFIICLRMVNHMMIISME